VAEFVVSGRSTPSGVVLVRAVDAEDRLPRRCARAASPGYLDVMIEVRGLSKRYGDRVAVDDLSFTIRPGHVTGFLGPNGAGKPVTEL
jgi:ABC-type uncharacterized transport system ATPase subunit